MLEHPIMPLRLLPCPFCGATPRLTGPMLVCVECDACGARGPRGMDIPDAVDKWNRCESLDQILRKITANAERL
jgi:Lar family restriction alleviation protein